jgi:hypothetical protein
MQSAQAEAVAQWLERKPTAVQWEVLPPGLRARLGSEAAWLRALRSHAIGRQQTWSAALAVEEKEYLAELLRTSREQLLLYPYHLADRLVACIPGGSTPFECASPVNRPRVRPCATARPRASSRACSARWLSSRSRFFTE